MCLVLYMCAVQEYYSLAHTHSHSHRRGNEHSVAHNRAQMRNEHDENGPKYEARVKLVHFPSNVKKKSLLVYL